MAKWVENAVIRVLGQRGLNVCQAEPYERTIFSQIEGQSRDDLIHLFSSYSFRIFLRDLISLRREISIEKFGLFFEEEKVLEYLETAKRFSILRKTENGYQFALDSITDVGDSFECYVSSLLLDEGYDSTWGVKFQGISSGGDFDILAMASGKLFYIETKTSPPKHLEASEISHFMERVTALMPDFAIILNDTHLRMKDKLVPLMEEEIGLRRKEDIQMDRLEREIFSFRGKIFITNSKRDILTNLKICLREYFTKEWERGNPLFT